mgnify:CR=1 FL=1
MFTNTPSILYLEGECGSVATLIASISLRNFTLSACAEPKKNLCSPVSPSITGDDFPFKEILYALYEAIAPAKSAIFSPRVNSPLRKLPGVISYDEY